MLTEPSSQAQTTARPAGARYETGTPRLVDCVVLATDGPALELHDLLPGLVVRTIRTRDELAASLAHDRPRVAVLVAPPAGAGEIALAAEARRLSGSLAVILLDGPDAVQERLAALRLGLDDAVALPIDPRELVGRLGVLLDREERRPARIDIGPGVALDTLARTLVRNGRRIGLRPKELGLLEFLADRPGRAFSRDELLDAVWGPDRHASPRTVDVHVRWLREKVERRPDRPERLVTVRGVGYRLDLEPARPNPSPRHAPHHGPGDADASVDPRPAGTTSGRQDIQRGEAGGTA